MVSTLSIVLFLVLGTVIHQSEAAPKVRIEKDAPPSVTLICDNIPTSSHVEWKKDDGLLDENARYKEMFSDRLEISPVYREDKGSFTCEVDGDQSEPVFLELFPSKPFIKPSTYGMQMGSSLSLECRDVSPETARVIWKRDGHIVANNLTSFSNLSRSNSDITGFRLSDDGHTLIFDNLSRSDNGIYNCMVKTPYGSSSSEDFSVDTAYGPLDVTVCVHISTGEEHCSTLNKPSKPVPILSSTSFTLNCTFDSKPHKDHKWKVPDGKVKTRQIEVKQPRKADSGPYTCEVWNEVTGKGANVSISIVVWGSTGVRCMALYGPTKRRLQCSLPNGTEQTLRFEASKGDSDYCVVTNSSPGSCPCFTANRNATCPVAQCEEPETRLRHLCTFNVYLASRVGGRETKVLSEFDPTHNVVPPAPHSVTIQDGMVNWKSPAAVYLTKYNFQVDFRKLPDGKWQQSKKETSDLLSFVPSNLKLMVRVRARPKDYEGFWSSWSPVVFSQATVPPGPSNDDTGWLFLYCILPLSVVCSFIASIALYFQRERIRHKIWPTIPDPKHWLERVLPTGNKLFSVAFKTPTAFCEAPFIPVEIVQSLTSITSILTSAEEPSLHEYFGEDHPGDKGTSGLTYVAVCSTGQVVGACLPEHPGSESKDLPAETYGEDAWRMPAFEAYISAEDMSKAAKQASDHGFIPDPITSSCGKPFAFDLQSFLHKQTSPSNPLTGQPYIAEALVRNADFKQPCTANGFVPETFVPASLQQEPTGFECKRNEESATEQTSQRCLVGEGGSGDAMVFLLGPVHCSSLDSTREEPFKDLAPVHHDGPVIYDTSELANFVLEFPNVQTILNNHHPSGDNAEVSTTRFHLLEPLPTSLNRSDVSTSEMDLDDYAQISTTLGPWELESYLT